jgi:hypothetical protein
VKPPTAAQLQDPSFCSYEKCLVTGARLVPMQCAECRGAAVAIPALTMRAPSNGTLVCPRCWHPLYGRLLMTYAKHGRWVNVRSKKWDVEIAHLADLGLLQKRGRWHRMSPTGLAVLWLKESVGWEFESAHARGWYRTERLPSAGSYTGYYATDGTWGQFIPHHKGSHRKPWPIQGVGVMHFARAS